VVVLKEGTVVETLGRDEIDDHRIMTAMAEGRPVAAQRPAAERPQSGGGHDGAGG
jgi:hypothetical protein